ncbi:lysophospholipid acyltransferase family protein [Thalassotalea aquiviva]|uniref:lysophospholipid acyltransferase family protein n=1 Tax=Thalassotalea aquiviva TaxID=3242415 RepID=UPI00352A9D8E
MTQKLPIPPPNVPRTNNQFAAWFGRLLINTSGWSLSGNLPDKKKFIVAVAPHTSNWDFLVGVRIKFALNLNLHFLGKDSLFKGLLGSWLRYLGGIPIDRSAPNGVVGQIVDRFNKEDELVIVIAPEGTRSKVSKWKTGFLQIAKQAKVPVVMVKFDYAKKDVHFYPERYIEGEIEQELASVQSLFSPDCAKIPQNF